MQFLPPYDSMNAYGEFLWFNNFAEQRIFHPYGYSIIISAGVL